MNRFYNAMKESRTAETIQKLEREIDALKMKGAERDLAMRQLMQGLSAVSTLSEARKTRMEALWAALVFVLGNGMDKEWVVQNAQFVEDAWRLVSLDETTR